MSKLGDEEDVRKWSRKLYTKHDKPDNFVDETFLKFKRTNGKREE
jgi:hypothetical protein